MGISIFDERMSFTQNVNIVAADTTTEKTLLTSISGGGARADHVFVSNTDGIDHKVDISSYASAIEFAVWSLNIPAGTGVGGVPAIDIVPLIFPGGQQGFVMNSGTIYHWRVAVTVVTGQVAAYIVGGYV